jgi:multidrug resistance efflux pump
VLRRVIVILLVVAALTAALVYSQWRPRARFVSGFVEADEIRVGSRVGGRVSKTVAREGQLVRAGDVLVELEPYDLNERRAQAQAELAAKQAELDRLKSGYRPEEIAESQAKLQQGQAKLAMLQAGPRKQEIAAGEARATLAEAQRSLAQRTLKRLQDSLAHNAASQDEVDHAADELAAAESTLAVRRQELDQLREGSRKEEITEAQAQVAQAQAALNLMRAGYRAEEIAQASAAVEAAKAALAIIDSQVAELTIKAPVDGVVQAVDLQPGDLVAANAPMLSMLDLSHLWVRAYVPENRLAVQVGDKVSISADSFPNRRFAGHIIFIASQAEFTPNNVQTPEERSKQVFRIKVEMDQEKDLLRPGMPVDVWPNS